MHPLKYLYGRNYYNQSMFVSWPSRCPTSHKEMAQILKLYPSSAGFTHIKHGMFRIFGKSESLDIKTREVDILVVESLHPDHYFTMEPRRVQTSVVVHIENLDHYQLRCKNITPIKTEEMADFLDKVIDESYNHY